MQFTTLQAYLDAIREKKTLRDSHTFTLKCTKSNLEPRRVTLPDTVVSWKRYPSRFTVDALVVSILTFWNVSTSPKLVLKIRK